MTDTKSTKPNRPRRMAREPEPEVPNGAEQDASAALPPSQPATAKPQTKAGLVEDLLRREEGASLNELCQATGWLPHTARAFLTGLRKKGRAIERSKVDGETRYVIASAIAP